VIYLCVITYDAGLTFGAGGLLSEGSTVPACVSYDSLPAAEVTVVVATSEIADNAVGETKSIMRYIHVYISIASLAILICLYIDSYIYSKYNYI